MAEQLCMGCMNTYKDTYKVCPHCGYVEGTAPKEAYHLSPGIVLQGKYIVGKVLGYGGFGVTYLGYNAILEQKVAIKEYLPGEFATRTTDSTEVTIFSGEREEQFAGGVVKFVEEAKRLAKFKTIPGIVGIYDSFEENKTAYIVMEYLEGETLSARIEREGKLSLDDSIKIMMPVLDALKEVHKEGILHRDISPDNIFLTNSGEVKLLDFGAARYATSTSHSKSLSVIVKPGYAPQEQYRSRGDQGTWTDVYACAATLYKMITGVTPEDSMERGNKDTLLPPSKMGVKIPKNKENAIMNALNLKVEDRTKDAGAFELDLYTDKDVKRNKVKDKKMDVGRWPLWLKITTGAVATAMATLTLLLVTGVISFGALNIFDKGGLEEGTVYVPNVVNYSLAEAESKTKEVNLITQIVDKQNSDNIPKDMVLSQNIRDGEVVKAGTVLELIVSAGGEIIYLSDYVGMKKEDVTSELDGLSLYYDIFEESNVIAPGYICAQELEEGSAVEKGNTINLTVSTGVADYNSENDTTVPDLVGKSWDEGINEISNAKLYLCKTAAEYSEEYPKGQIISQDVEKDTSVKEGTNIGVVVSLGIKMTRVPDVQFKAKVDAELLMSEANLVIDIQYEESDTVAKDHVIRQSIEAGTEVEMQTVVTVWLSLGNPEAEEADATITTESTTTEDSGTSATTEAKIESTTEERTETTTRATTEANNSGIVIVPNVTGMSEGSACSVLSSLGIVPSVSYYYNSAYSTGTVFEQSDTGLEVQIGTYVTIYVCNNESTTEYRHKITAIVETTDSNYGGTVISTREELSEWGDWIECINDWNIPYGDNCESYYDEETQTYKYRTRTVTTYYTYQVIDYTEWSTEMPIAGAGESNVTYELETRETAMYSTWQ